MPPKVLKVTSRKIDETNKHTQTDTNLSISASLNTILRAKYTAKKEQNDQLTHAEG